VGWGREEGARGEGAAMESEQGGGKEHKRQGQVTLRLTPTWLSWRRRKERPAEGAEGVEKRGVVVVVRAKRPTAPPRAMRRSCLLVRPFEPLSLVRRCMVLLLRTKRVEVGWWKTVCLCVLWSDVGWEGEACDALKVAQENKRQTTTQANKQRQTATLLLNSPIAVFGRAPARK